MKLDLDAIGAVTLVGCGLAIWWIKNNFELAFLILRILAYISAIVIAIYCIMRMLGLSN